MGPVRTVCSPGSCAAATRAATGRPTNGAGQRNVPMPSTKSRPRERGSCARRGGGRLRKTGGGILVLGDAVRPSRGLSACRGSGKGAQPPLGDGSERFSFSSRGFVSAGWLVRKMAAGSGGLWNNNMSTALRMPLPSETSMFGTLGICRGSTGIKDKPRDRPWE